MLTTLHNEWLTVTTESKGAEMQSLIAQDGISYLWDGKKPFWGRRSPTLFPIIGKLRDNHALSASGNIDLPKHGFCRDAPFELLTSDDISVTYAFSDTHETRERYPFHFRLLVTHSLQGKSVTTSYTVENTGDNPMPYCVGGHPAFHVPLSEDEAFTDYIVEFDQPETADCPLIDTDSGLIDDSVYNRLLTNDRSFRLNHVLFRQDALIFDHLHSQGAKLYSSLSGHGVHMEFGDFCTFAVWSPVKDAPFVCFEPWQGGATRKSEDDWFEHKHGAVVALPGESRCFSYTITVL